MPPEDDRLARGALLRRGFSGLLLPELSARRLSKWSANHLLNITGTHHSSCMHPCFRSCFR